MREVEVMKLYHTSPKKISKVSKDGLFGSGLCFSTNPYFMTPVPNPVTYSVEIDKSEIIEISRIWYQEDSHAVCKDEIQEMMEIAGVDEDTAMEILDESMNVYDLDNCSSDLADASFASQRLSLSCAVKLGFRGLKGRDEQGAVYIIDMFGRENELKNEVDQ